MFSSMALKGVKAASGALALASIKVLQNPDIAKKAKKELKEATGGKYICPIPKDIQPNVNK